ncbi:alpha--mannosyltransferase alg11p [Moniliophthora roreri]|uniref:Uncharacterized protein n=1 Tax=Moniliophthora roreri TaxID=221103 RepID=A0A0W0EY71_MONRR|nr:alpha--mannosyltransferase alg11p [Moniliophthora roreri]
MAFDFEASELTALGIFASYFIIIFALFAVILNSLPWSRLNSSPKCYLFLLLTIGSLVHTWYYMLKYMATSLDNFESKAVTIPETLLKRMITWLQNTYLFEEAWTAACSGKLNWWWSEQICVFTAGAWTVFLFEQGQRYKIKHLWAYMVLGQFVAITVATNLFYLALILAGWQFGAAKRTYDAPPVLWVSVLLSMITVANSPYTDTESFLPNLLIMHAFIIIPLFFIERHGHYASKFSMPYQALYIVLYVIGFVLRIKTTLVGIRSVSDEGSLWENFIPFIKSILAVLHSHPAQASIGWDVIWTSLSFVIWTCLNEPSIIAPIGTAIASAGVVAPWMAASTELEEAGKLD